MEKSDFLGEIRKDITNLLSEYTLANYKKQLFAWKLNATFNRTFSEHYLWNRALFLTTNSCMLLQNNPNEKTAIEGLYESAEIYEYLSEIENISELFDKDYLRVLSALCYDLSGYQANAYCLANKITVFTLATTDSGIDLSVDNKIIEQIKLILLKKIEYANHILKDDTISNDIGYTLFCGAISDWYSYILKQNDLDYNHKIHTAYFYYLSAGNTYLAHLLFLLETRILLFKDRSIWKNIESQIGSNRNYQWKKYVRLLAYDYYSNSNIKNTDERKSIFEFWTSQLRAIESGLLSKDDNFVVQMPTSSGKTFIAELLILKYLINSPDKKCIYIAPFRALTNEKEGELGKYFEKLGYSVSSLSGSYEIDAFQDVVLSATDLLIATPEKIDVLLRFNPDFFSNVSLMVVDEGHIIGDISTRATLLEFLIIRLRIKLPDLKTLFISAVMPTENANEYSLWLSGKETNVLRSLKYCDSNPNEEWEPTRKLISSFEWTGTRGDIRFKGITTGDETAKSPQGAILYNFLIEKEFANKYPRKGNKAETAVALAYKLSFTGSTLVFCAQPRYTLSVAKTFLAFLDKVDLHDSFNIKQNKISSYYAKMWYGEDNDVTKAIDHGIGIHFGDMPEQVRIAVEDDFRSGLLTVLLSTNTIGQGLNFPIKNIVFYHTLITQGKVIQNRDFWNIVGRAGRAGKETEGRIIFIINSYTDKQSYSNLTNKANIENAESLFFKALRLVNHPDFSNEITLLSETYLLDLIVEDMIGTEYEEIIEKIIHYSLFKIQSDKRNIDVSPLKNEFRRIFKAFEQEATFEELQRYKSTGLSFSSNKQIQQFIEKNLETLNAIVNADDYLGIVAHFLILLSTNSISEMRNDKLDTLYNEQNTPVDFMPIITKWITGTSLEDIVNTWKNELKLDIRKLHIFISQGLYYLYPWGLFAFLIILSFKIEKEYTDLPDNIRNSASYLKFGLNTDTSCLACSLGIKSRQTSIFLSEKSNRMSTNDFIHWLSNLSFEEIESFEIPSFEKENIIDVSLKLTPKSPSGLFPTVHSFTLKGTIFYNEWMITSKSIVLGDKLNYQRKGYNEHDPFAILILKDDSPVGYIPRDYSRLISPEIDIEDKEYDIVVTRIDEKDEYNEICVNMSEQFDFTDFGIE